MNSIGISVRNLQKIYRKKGDDSSHMAIENLNFDIEPGEMVSIVGRTGCGKSTFFNILLGLEFPTSGDIFIGGQTPYGDFQEMKGRIGVIFQQDRLLPWRTARKNVELGLEILKFNEKSRKELSERWLKRLGLENFMDAYPHELSGGMRQRVAMARTFASNPKILLADESFGHLDEVTAKDLRQEFLTLIKSQGSTGILITHQLDEAIEISDRILVFGRPATLLADIRPQNMELSELSQLKSHIQGILNETALV